MMLSDSARYVYWFLTDTEFDLGTVGLADYEERAEVFSWLVSTEETGAPSDPRGVAAAAPELVDADVVDEQRSATDQPLQDAQTTSGAAGVQDEHLLKLVPMGLHHRWCFTKNDPDSYPSVPHGHLHDKTNPWPKLNPYVGRAFVRKDQEDTRYRLTKPEMITLWNDPSFRQHALETIAWYSQAYPYYKFPVRHPRRLPRWRRR